MCAPSVIDVEVMVIPSRRLGPLKDCSRAVATDYLILATDEPSMGVRGDHSAAARMIRRALWAGERAIGEVVKNNNKIQ
jgi:hypothetical protein